MADDRLKRIEEKVDKVEEAISEIKVTLVRNTISLEEHMRRSDAIEEYVQSLDRHLNENVVKKDLEPIKRHVSQVTWAIKGIFWFIGIVGTLLVTLKQLEIL